MSFKKLNYHLLASFRRQSLDRDLEKIKDIFKGKILDVGGGRQRGKFKLSQNKKITIVDICKQFKPDVVANVEKLPFNNGSFNVIKATELFEHVKNPESGISECARVLKKGGYFVFSMPFLYPIHSDPNDFQRWTEKKLRIVLKKYALKIEKFQIQGYYFTVLGDMVKKLILNSIWFVRYPLYLLILPLIYILVFFDDKFSVQNPLLNKYHGGYFIICRKQ